MSLHSVYLTSEGSEDVASEFAENARNFQEYLRELYIA